MRKLLLYMLLILALPLSACSALSPESAAPTSPPAASEMPPPPTEQPLPTPILPPTLSGDLSIQQLMLDSHNRWKTLQATYSITSFPSGDADTEPEVKTVQLWIRLPAEFKVQVGPPGGDPLSIVISDGRTIQDSLGSRQDLPTYVLQPFNPPNYPSDTVYLHPLAGFLGTPVSDLVFPAGLAQRGGDYQKTGNEVVAGREAYVVEWRRQPDVLIDRFWVDRQTGIVLRQQNYGKDQSVSPTTDIQASFIDIDGTIADATFDLDQIPTPAPTPQGPEPGTASITVLDIKGILNVRSGPNVSYKIIATLDPGTTLPVIGKSEAGDWWKVDLGDQTGWVIGSFVEFTGDPDKVPVLLY
jgi:outer membrane lipoprotein-sorting protein